MARRPKIRLSNRAAEALSAGALWDAEVPGFGLRVLPSGRKTWVLKYWTRGDRPRQGWATLGTFPALSADEARKLARDARGAVEKGADPVQDRKAARRAAADAERFRIDRLVPLYAAELAVRPSMRGGGPVSARHSANELMHLRRALAEMGAEGVPAARVGAEDLAGLLRHHAARPATARARFGAVSRFLDWCRQQGAIARNPAEDIGRRQRPKPPRPRSRMVSLPDLAALWLAAPVLAPTYADLARVLMVLPARRGEAARMDWRDVDLDQAIWRLPGAITKNGDPHMLALPPLVLDLLRARHVAAGRPAAGPVFPPARGAAVGAWSDMRARLAKASGVTGWSWHDFRRSFASLMAERGVPEPVADAILNHRQSATRAGVLGAYQVSRRWQEQRDALLSWGAALADAIEAAKGPQR